MIFYLLVALLPVVMVLKARIAEIRMTPDGARYQNMAAPGRRTVERPYAWRPLVPYTEKAIARLTGREAKLVATVVNGAAACILPLVSAAVAWKLSGGVPEAALAAAWFIVLSDSVFYLSWCWPYLVDGGAALLALSAVAAALSGWWAAAILLMTATWLAKEGWAVAACAFLAPLVGVGASAALGVPGAIIYAALVLFMPTMPPTKADPWLVRPFAWAQKTKRTWWFDWQRNAAPLGILPFALCTALVWQPKPEVALAALLCFLVFWLQCHTATDHGRLLGHCVVFLAPLTAAFLPVWALFPLGLAMFWMPGNAKG